MVKEDGIVRNAAWITVKTLSVAGLVSFTLYTADALAGDASKRTDSLGETGDAGFNVLDANKNGVLDREEAGGSASLSASFDRADRNQDGQLSSAEFSAFDKSGGEPAGEAARKGQEIPEDTQKAKPVESWFTSPEDQPR